MILSQFLVDVASGSGPVRWETWFPVSIEAQSGDRWAEAWGELDVERQYAVLERLHADGSIFADMLLQLAARHPASVEEPPVREMVLADAAQAGERQLRAMRVQHAELLASAEATQTEQAEVLAGIVELEAQLSRFQSEHVGDDYSRMVELQKAVARLQLQSTELANYDWSGQESLRQDLTSEVSALAAQRSGLDEEVGALRAQRSGLQRDVEAVEAELVTHTAEIHRLQAQVDGANAELASLTEQVAERTREQARVAREQLELEQRATQLEEALRRDRQALQELSGSPVGADADRIGMDIDALFARLPADRADSRFETRTTA